MPKVIDEWEVYKAVIRVLVERGYERATTVELAAAAGMHEATLFRKYGSKAGLVDQAIEHLLSQAPLSSVRYTGDLEADLLAILEAYTATAAEYGAIVPLLLLEIPRVPELRSALHAPLENIRGIAQILTRYQSEGLLIEELPLASVNALLAPILMGQMLRQSGADLDVPVLDLRECVSSYLNGRKRSPRLPASAGRKL